MGFEIIYHFHERDENGNYKKEEVKQLKRKTGEVFEDIPLEKLASVIMLQLARRDIWVVDVEIYEYKKQKISFRETKGGIVIKNKKFMLDNESNIIMQEIKEEQIYVPDNGTLVPTIPHNKKGSDVRPIKWVILDPDVPNLHKVKQKGLQFSINKKYPVLAESNHPTQVGVNIYKILDDYRREITVSNEYFLPADIKLESDDQLGFTKPLDVGPKLLYEEVVPERNMPDVRGRK